MPTLRTEASELAVAFGILSLDTSVLLVDDELDRYFRGTLSRDKYQDFLGEYANRNQLHFRMLRVGRHLRSNEPLFSQVESLEWAGPSRQASTATASADLLVANTPVSVKAISNVVANPSPHNLIYNLPSGQAFTHNEQNWYIVQDLAGFQSLYSFVRNSSPSLSYLHTSVEVFESTATSDDRNRVQDVISSYTNIQRQRFIQYYLAMCHRVAEISADVFNNRISQSLHGRSRVAIIENLMRWFFRLDSVSYVLCGIDDDHEFGVRIPSITQWKSDWNLSNIQASPDISRRQSVVDFDLSFANSSNQINFNANFHAQLRWSHGRFCGVPEAKLYKEFHWDDLPFFRCIL